MSNKEHKKTAAHMIVHGRVQGVGFRYYTLETAQNLGLVGWVKNLWDGTVEVWAEGPKKDVQSLIAAVRQGPSMAFVQRVDLEWYTPKGSFDTFRVRY